MAALTAGQVTKLWMNNAVDRCVLYEVSGVTAADTLDVGSSGAVTDFRVVKVAGMIPVTGTATGMATVSGTTVTFPTGLSNDAGYLLVWGERL